MKKYKKQASRSCLKTPGSLACVELNTIQSPTSDCENNISLVNDNKNKSEKMDDVVNNLYEGTQHYDSCAEYANASFTTRFASSLRRKASLSKSWKNSSIKSVVPCSESVMLTNTGYIPINDDDQQQQCQVTTTSLPCDSRQNWIDNPQYELVTKEEEPLYAPIYHPSPSDEIIVPLYQLQNIKMIKTLGLGFFGKVLLAEIIDPETKNSETKNPDDNNSKRRNHRVAVKMLKAECSESVKLAFHKELKFMSRLQHENVVRVLGACTEDEPFIVMEYIEGGALSSYLLNYDDICATECEISEFVIHTATLISICTQMACGMKYLSSKNYIHRDLAARNVLVGDNTTVKISDFGMSRNLYASHYYVMESRGAVPIRWMAKECFFNKFSTKSDVWSFAITMWEVFTLGKNIPFEEMTDFEVLEDAVKTERNLLSIPDKCPPEVYGIMLKCWGFEANDRPNFETIYDMLLPLNSIIFKKLHRKYIT